MKDWNLAQLAWVKKFAIEGGDLFKGFAEINDAYGVEQGDVDDDYYQMINRDQRGIPCLQTWGGIAECEVFFLTY